MSRDKSKSKQKPNQDDNFLREMRKRAQQGASYWADNWENAESDLRFLNGDQWDDQVKTERANDGRPCLTNNVLPTFVDQIIGEQLQNRPAIKISARSVTRSVDNSDGEELKISNATGTKDYTLAEVMTGLVKNIEYNCDAETSYDIAFQGAVQAFAGFLRVRSDYLSDDTFQQDLIIDHIENQFSVVMCPDGNEPDFSDCPWVFIHDKMPREEFEALYPGAPIESLESGSTAEYWCTEESVRVSEYYVRETKVKELALLSDGREM